MSEIHKTAPSKAANKQIRKPPAATSSKRTRDAEERLAALFALAKEVGAEVDLEQSDGNAYRSAIEEYVDAYGDYAFAALQKELPKQSPTIQFATLLYTARQLDNYTARKNVKMYEGFLKSDVWNVRDAAGLALADLDEASALPALREAISQEPSSLLKALLQQTADYLNR